VPHFIIQKRISSKTPNIKKPAAIHCNNLHYILFDLYFLGN